MLLLYYAVEINLYYPTTLIPLIARSISQIRQIVEIKGGRPRILVTPSSPMQNSIRGLIDEIFKLPIPRHVSGLGHAAHSNNNASASFFFLPGVDTFPVIEKIGIALNRQFTKGSSMPMTLIYIP